jgi:hypothetical protein
MVRTRGGPPKKRRVTRQTSKASPTSISGVEERASHPVADQQVDGYVANHGGGQKDRAAARVEHQKAAGQQGVGGPQVGDAESVAGQEVAERLAGHQRHRQDEQDLILPPLFLMGDVSLHGFPVPRTGGIREERLYVSSIGDAVTLCRILG